MNGEKARPEVQLMQMLRGKYISRSVTAVAELGIADLIGDGSASVADLAGASGANPEALNRLMRAVASLGMFEASSDGRYANTALSDALREDRPNSMREAARWMNSQPAWLAWGRLDHSMMTGDSAFEEVFGEMVFDYFQKHEAERSLFHGAMSTVSRFAARAVAEGYDFSGVKTVVDVGAGTGALVFALMEKHPSLHAVLYDRAEVLELCSVPEPFGSRLEKVEGSFFDRVPEGGDVYVLKSVLHDWSDKDCVQILRSCSRGLVGDARLLAVENLVASGPAATNTLLLDLEMLVLTKGGRERTESEFRALFQSAGLKLKRIVPTESSLVVMEVVRDRR